jgi:hypothetical protein
VAVDSVLTELIGGAPCKRGQPGTRTLSALSLDERPVLGDLGGQKVEEGAHARRMA